MCGDRSSPCSKKLHVACASTRWRFSSDRRSSILASSSMRFARAGIPGYFDRGTRRPHPAGRAFLALLSCAVEKLSAKRFAEYLSLAQVPNLDASGRPKIDNALRLGFVWQTKSSACCLRIVKAAKRDCSPTCPKPEASKAKPTATRIHVSCCQRNPEDTVAVGESAGRIRRHWRRRPLGAASERPRPRIRAEDPRASSEQADSPKIARLERERRNLEHLRAFALPLIESMAGWSDSANWGDWLQRLRGFVPGVLRKPAMCCACLPISGQWARSGLLR